MTSKRTLIPVFLAAPLLLSPAFAQTDQAASLLEALSLVSGGMLTAPLADPQVSADGDRYRIRVPLPKLTTPPDAAIEGMAIPHDGGIWDITALAFPAAGTLVTPGADAKPPVSLAYTIARQDAHARVDASLASPSPYAMDLSGITLRVEANGPPMDLSIGHVAMNGTMTGDAGHRMNLRSTGRSEDWRVAATGASGVPFTLSMRSASYRYDVDSLDRAQMLRLRQATRAVAANQPAVAPGQAAPVAALQDQLRAMLDGSANLLDGFAVDETFQGLRFDVPGSTSGALGEARIAMTGQSRDHLVAADIEYGLNDLTLTGVPPQFAPYVPTRMNLKAGFAGIEAESLRHWLREATETGADPAAMQAEAIAMLSQPGARAGVESVLLESGPLLIQGSARVKPLPDGTPEYEIHLTAHGLDKMLAMIQSDPKAQQIMPMLFLAKGMGKQEGDSVVWDIVFAHGAATVNGVPMGGAPATARPPGKR